MNKRFEKLIEYRKFRGYTQKRMSELMGIALSTYTGWELGLGKPDIYELKKLAEVLHTTTDSLLDDKPISQEMLSAQNADPLKISLTPNQLECIKGTIDILHLAIKNNEN